MLGSLDSGISNVKINPINIEMPFMNNGINNANPSQIPKVFRPFIPLNVTQLFKCPINDLFSLLKAINAPNAGPNAPINSVKPKIVCEVSFDPKSNKLKFSNTEGNQRIHENKNNEMI